ncbi:MAG TPA: helix-turn-helix transcriptional regulator [Rubrivivax sp.]|nr:helix-turn-helix transcriptional regulator [Rubrivivax sp.]
MQIKDQIRVRREALGMDMHQLAMRVGVTEQAVRHWESGRSYPSKSKIRLIEEALSFTMDWSEGANPVAEGRTAAAMVDPKDVDLLLVICKLPLRAKNLLGDLARMHLEAVERSRPEPPPSADPLAAARTAVAEFLAVNAVDRDKLLGAWPPSRSAGSRNSSRASGAKTSCAC